jgi:hypothetical protein
VPLVYTVSFRGKLSVPPEEADADADDPDAVELLLGEPELVHAVAAPSVRMATAAVPYRHRLPALLLVGLTAPTSSLAKMLR